MTNRAWLEIEQRDAPLVMSFPHTGTEIPAPFDEGLVSLERARLDADWWIDRLYAFGREMGATFVRTRISRTVVDVNRDPSGTSLYPGQTTTGLCPVETFDGAPLYIRGREPDQTAIDLRRDTFLAPYHAALQGEIARLRARHDRVVLYDCHSIRSVIPRLFEGQLPHFNVGTNSGASCGGALADAVVSALASPSHTHVLNGRFKGGYITRHFGKPDKGVHAIQMELACRTYMREPEGPIDENVWPTPFAPDHTEKAMPILRKVIEACLAFARN